MPSTTFTNRQLFSIKNGLRNLDGVQSESGKIKRFEFNDDEAWLIAQDSVVVEGALAAYEFRRKTLLKKYSIVEGAQLTLENAADYSAFLEELEAAKDMAVEVPAIKFIELATLRKAGVRVPSILTDLMPIIAE